MDQENRDDRRMSWWPWVLGIIGLFILAALLLPFLTNNQPLSPAPEVGVGGAPEAEEIRDLSTITQDPNPSNLAGRSVRLDSVTVLEVINDNLFWVGTTENGLLLVSVDDKTIGLFTDDGPTGLQPGETVSLQGELRQVPSVDEIMTQWNLDESQANALSAQEVYLLANEVGRTEEAQQ